MCGQKINVNLFFITPFLANMGCPLFIRENYPIERGTMSNVILAGFYY
jgi:hypothetical protein